MTGSNLIEDLHRLENVHAAIRSRKLAVVNHRRSRLCVGVLSYLESTTFVRAAELLANSLAEATNSTSFAGKVRDSGEKERETERGRDGERAPASSMC